MSRQGVNEIPSESFTYRKHIHQRATSSSFLSVITAEKLKVTVGNKKNLQNVKT